MQVKRTTDKHDMRTIKCAYNVAVAFWGNLFAAYPGIPGPEGAA